MYKLYTLYNKFIEETLSFPKNFTGIIEWDDGHKEWHTIGKIHRISGFAIENPKSGLNYWYIDDKQVTKEQHALYVDLLRLKGLL